MSRKERDESSLNSKMVKCWSYYLSNSERNCEATAENGDPPVAFKKKKIGSKSSKANDILVKLPACGSEEFRVFFFQFTQTRMSFVFVLL